VNDDNINKDSQLGLFSFQEPVIHYFDKNGALRSGYLVRWIKKGKKKGLPVVRESNGKYYVPGKIRNVEYKYKDKDS